MLTAAEAVQAEPRTSSAAKSEETLDESLRPKFTTAELEAQFLQWERTRLTAHILPPGDGPRNRVAYSTGTLHNGVFVQRLLPPGPRASTVSSAETAKDPYSSPVSYIEAFSAELTTISYVAKHENRIYQPGYTPGEIRSKIKSILRTILPAQHIEDFQRIHIPPEN